MDLVILAAGMGSRFGGLKQIQPIDVDGNFIIDYSIFDAIKTGFDRVVFVIKEENLEAFRNTVGKRIEKQIEVAYAFQQMNSFLPQGFAVHNRVKPWGTAHAILCAKDKVKDNFVIINADDYYGGQSLMQIYKNLSQIDKDSKDFYMVGFRAKNTLTENGTVKRGICNIKDNKLESFTESVIEEDDKTVYATTVGKDDKRVINPETLVSMNLFGFTPKLFDYLEEGFKRFLQSNRENLETCEYFIPTILSEYIKEHRGNIRVIDTHDKWYGMTYQKDYPIVCEGIRSLVEKGLYPKHLWVK